MGSREAPLASMRTAIDAGGWRRGPESNRPTRICNPVHNRFATAPSSVSRRHQVRRCRLDEKGKPRLPFLLSGAGEESRTLDLNLGKVALYQLSYSRVELICLPDLLSFHFASPPIEAALRYQQSPHYMPKSGRSANPIEGLINASAARCPRLAPPPARAQPRPSPARLRAMLPARAPARPQALGRST